MESEAASGSSASLSTVTSCTSIGESSSVVPESPAVTEVGIEKEKIPKKPRYKKIFYCSRTHSQLQQVVTEFRNCHPEYTANVKMTILGSRKHLCTNDKAKNAVRATKDLSLDEKCAELCKANECFHSTRAKLMADILSSRGVWVRIFTNLGHWLSTCSLTTLCLICHLQDLEGAILLGIYFDLCKL